MNFVNDRTISDSSPISNNTGIINEIGKDMLSGTNHTSVSSSSSKSGHLNFRASVQFVGLPCPPNSEFFSVPPCNGPYPNYEIIIYGDDGKTIVSKIITDSNGIAQTMLDSGSYSVHTKAGISTSDIKTTHFTIEEHKITQLSLFVDTGLE